MSDDSSTDVLLDLENLTGAGDWGEGDADFPRSCAILDNILVRIAQISSSSAVTDSLRRETGMVWALRSIELLRTCFSLSAILCTGAAAVSIESADSVAISPTALDWCSKASSLVSSALTSSAPLHASISFCGVHKHSEEMCFEIFVFIILISHLFFARPRPWILKQQHKRILKL